MRKKLILTFITLLISSFLFATPTDQNVDGNGNNSELLAPDVSFSFYFTKPTRDVFGFCEPGNPNVEFSGSAGGLQFPLASETSPFSSSGSIGVYYSLQGKCRLSVWCNASQNHTDTWRMRRLKDNGQPNEDVDGLNYTIQLSGAASDAIPSEYADKNFDVPDLVDPKKPVFQVFHNGSGTKEGNVTISMNLTSPERDGDTILPYMEGQYKGYIIMQYFSL